MSAVKFERDVTTHDFRKGLWGHAVSMVRPVAGTDRYSVFGHGSNNLAVDSIPKAGHDLLLRMESGRDARWRLVECESCRDPKDMWKGVMEFVGYEDDPAPVCSNKETEDA